MKLKNIQNKRKLELPAIDVGDQILVGKFKNTKATVTGFKTDKHGQPILKTNRGEKQLFKPRLKKLMVDEGLIQVPKSTLNNIKFILLYQLLWYAKNNFSGKRVLFKQCWDSLNTWMDKFPRPIPDEPFEPKTKIWSIDFEIQSLPEHYPKSSSTTIKFEINWTTDSKIHAAWNPKTSTIVIYPLSLDYIFKWPKPGSHPDDFSLAFKSLTESITHELRHAVQFLVLKHPYQTKTLKDYNLDQGEYYRSPVEFDPTIGSKADEFLNTWAIYYPVSSDLFSNKNFIKTLRHYVSDSKSNRFGRFPPSDFFVKLKSQSPEKYKLAVKKFVIELRRKVQLYVH